MKPRALLLLAVSWAAAWAQHSNGYVFFAPGAIVGGGGGAMTFHLGGGGEGILGRGIGVGVELGALGPRAFSDALGVLSANGYYHFRHGKHHKVDPFVTGGYSLFFRGGTMNMYNFGVGANYWFSDRLGFRLELRDQLGSWCGCYTANFPSLRFGLSLRSGG